MEGTRVIAFILLALSWRQVRAIPDINVCNPDPPQPSVGPANLPMPPLAEAYTVGVMVNTAEYNSSYELIFGTDGQQAYTVKTEHGVQEMLIGDYQRKQLIMMTRAELFRRPSDCGIKNLNDAAKEGLWLFGYNNTIGSPHPNDPAWVFRFKDFDEQYVGKSTQLGIPCNEWQACKEIPARDQKVNEIGLVGIKFYWSDPDIWTPAIGQVSKKTPSVPVKIELRRKVDGKIITEEFIIFRYFDVAPPDESFMVPQGVFCPRLDGENVTLPQVPSMFSYESEILIQKNFETLIFYQKHFFDDQLKISRMEFNPILPNETIPIGVDENIPIGRITQIHDFNLGLSYLINKDYDRCAVSPIGKEEDVQSVAHSKVRMQNPMAFLGLSGINYTYYGQRMERNIPATLFMGKENNDTIYEYYFSGLFVESEGEEMWTHQKPIKFSKYSEIDPDNKKYLVHTNIFNFDVDAPEILQYDITACTPPDQRHLLQFQLDGRYNIIEVPNIVSLKHEILVLLAATMRVSPLRIHDIQLDTTDTTTIIQFTLLMKQNVTGDVDIIPTAPESLSDLAIHELRKTIDDKRFAVVVHQFDTNMLLAIPNSLVETQGFVCKPGTSLHTVDQMRMPRLDSVFEAGMLVNVGQNKSSYEMYMGQVGDKAYVKRVFGGIELTLIGDYFRKQLIEMTGELGDPRPSACFTKSLDEAARLGQWIFGYNTTGDGGYPHPDDPGWVFQYNDFQEQYMGTSEVLGIPCNRWMACQEVNFKNRSSEMVQAEFYWSDRNKWTAAAGANISVPVKVVLTTNMLGLKVVKEFVFLSYVKGAVPNERFEIPEGVFCSGLGGDNTTIQQLPDFFSFDSEILVRQGIETFVYDQKHYFDNALNLTRMDYKEGSDDDSSQKSPNQITRIHDFNAGLSYVIDVTNGTCRGVSAIEQDSEDAQSTHDQVRMRNPMSYLLQDINYTYYESKPERGIPAKLFMGKKTGTVYEYWFSSPRDNFDMEGMWEINKPLKFSWYPLGDPDVSSFSAHTNIFNFDLEEPEILNYDISPCTPVTQRRHLTFQLRGRYDKQLKVPSVIAFKHQILASLRSTMLVSPLRINNIELDVAFDTTIVTFRLLAKNKNQCMQAENYDEVSSGMAFMMLQDRIDNNIFYVGLPGMNVEEYFKAIPHSLRELINPLAVTCNSVPSTSGQPTIDMPHLGTVYMAAVLVTEEHTNNSYELIFGTDGQKAYVKKLFGGIELTLIGDYYRRQLIAMTGRLSDPTPAVCNALSLENAATTGSWIFGYNKTGENGLPHPDDPGWVFRYNYFNLSFAGGEYVLGIPCLKWIACEEVDLQTGREQVQVVFYWSDPNRWTAALGRDKDYKTISVPVRTVVSRNGDDQKLVQEYNFFSYTPYGPSQEQLDIPQGVFCVGLNNENITIPTVPGFFSYDSEILVTEDFFTKVLYQKHFFDHGLNLSRMEFTPESGELSPVIGNELNVIGKMTQIHDFNAGLSYLINSDRSTCNVTTIEQGEDAKLVAHSKVRMRNPMAYLQLTNVNYTYYEEKTERGLSASVFMGVRMENNEAIANEYWFSAPMVELEGDDMWTDKKPIKFLEYPAAFASDRAATLHINIFNFDVDEPEILSYDISACTPLEQQRHLQFELSGPYYLTPGKSLIRFQRLILTALIGTMNVSPLRVHNIEVDTSLSTTMVYFTLLAKQTIKGNSEISDYKDLPSDIAIKKLRRTIWHGMFAVGIPGTKDGMLIAVKNSFRVLDDVACTPNPTSTDSTMPMPKLGTTYTAGVLVNSGKDNTSTEMFFGTDGQKTFVLERTGGIDVTLIGDYDRGQVIAMTKLQNDIRPRFCKSESLEEAANDTNWIFGYNKTGEHPHQDDPGWVFHYKEFNEQYIGPETVLGIPCNRWDACKRIKFRGAKRELVGVKFYWSDPEQWTPATGKDPTTNKPYSVPVKVEITRRIDDQKFIEEHEFFRFTNDAPAAETFDIPQGVFCLGLSNESVAVPKVPDYFSYDSEIIVKKGLEEYVFYQKHLQTTTWYAPPYNTADFFTGGCALCMEQAKPNSCCKYLKCDLTQNKFEFSHYFDDELQLSRMEFSPVQDDKYLPVWSRTNTTVEHLTQIHDFIAGLSYLVDEDAGTCVASAINPNDEDVQNVTNSKVRMRNPMGFLKLQDVTYTYYQQKKIRDISASQYMGLQKGDLDMVYEYWFSSVNDELEGEGMWSTKVPLEFAMYPLVDPDEPIASVHTNIFNFDVEEPEILQYDISACTPPDQQRHLKFQIPILYGDLPSELQFKHQILVALVDSMMVSPLRIHNIELDEHDQATIIIFTLLAKQTTTGDAAYYNAENELSSDDAIKMLQKRMDADLFLIGTPNGEQDYVKPDKGTLETIADRPIVPPNCPKTPPGSPDAPSGGYSGGSMAGMAIGMLLVGGLLGFGAIFLLRRHPTLWPAAFGHKTFMNNQEGQAVELVESSES